MAVIYNDDMEVQHWKFSQRYVRYELLLMFSINYYTLADVNNIYCQCLFVKLVDNINYNFLYPAY